MDNTEKIKLVYDDIIHRLINDNDNSWKIITLSGILLTILGTFFTQNPSLGLSGKAIVILAAIFFLLAIFTGLISLLLYRDLKRLPFKRILLDAKAMQAYEENINLFENAFHTQYILRKGLANGAQVEYGRSLTQEFDQHLTNYIFYLSNMVEVKKRPRILSLFFMLLGSIAITVVLIVQFVH